MKRGIHILVVSLLISGQNLIAAEETPDRLLNEAHQLTGEARYAFLSKHISTINNVYQDTVLHFAEEAYILYQEIKKPRINGLAHFLYANYYSLKDEYSKSLKWALEAEQILVECNDTLNLARVYNEMGIVYSRLSDYEKSSHYYKKALDLIGKKDNNDLRFTLEINLANVLALFNNTEPLILLKKTYDNLDPKDVEKLATVANAITIGYSYTDHDDSTKYYSELAIRHLNEAGDKEGLGIHYHVLGNFYLRKNELQKAGEYIGKAIDIAETLNTPATLSERYFSMTGVLRKKGDYEQAQTYLEKGEKLVMNQLNTPKFRGAYYVEAA
jgi:tetratricopeptide (TPR) repeat protein